MAALDTIANYAEIFGAITVIGGLIFASIQVRAFRMQRRDAASIALLTSYMDRPEIVECARRILAPENEDIVAAVERDASLQDSIYHINAVAESIGLMVFSKAITIEQAADWGGGGIVATWRRVEPLAQKQREETGRKGAYDWYEWLAVQFEKHTPEYLTSTVLERHGDWKPAR